MSISERLEKEGIIKSKNAFRFLAVFSGKASNLKPGDYALDAAKSSFELMQEIVSGPHREAVVTIPEGYSIFEIDRELSSKGISLPGVFFRYAKEKSLEGKLFPDTYIFFTNSLPEDIAEKFLTNFKNKTSEIFGNKSDKEILEILKLAALIEKEVPGDEDRAIISGILKKRMKLGVPLQVDATICYVKKASAYPQDVPCYPLGTLDFKVRSDYNTYLHKGLTPTPIGNPGISAIKAAIYPKESPYLYYLSDPKTKKTVFSKTLEEQNDNRSKYLGL